MKKDLFYFLPHAEGAERASPKKAWTIPQKYGLNQNSDYATAAERWRRLCSCGTPAAAAAAVNDENDNDDDATESAKNVLSFTLFIWRQF